MDGVLGSAFPRGSPAVTECLGLCCRLPQDLCMRLWVSPEPLHLLECVRALTLFVEGFSGSLTSGVPTRGSPVL